MSRYQCNTSGIKWNTMKGSYRGYKKCPRKGCVCDVEWIGFSFKWEATTAVLTTPKDMTGE